MSTKCTQPQIIAKRRTTTCLAWIDRATKYPCSSSKPPNPHSNHRDSTITSNPHSNRRESKITSNPSRSSFVQTFPMRPSQNLERINVTIIMESSSQFADPFPRVGINEGSRHKGRRAKNREPSTQVVISFSFQDKIHMDFCYESSS
jgi:hypothetical protein